MYIHIPFCPYRCPYCDFAIVVHRAVRPEAREAYLNRLQGDLRQWADRFSGVEILSIFFGGGTPSLLRPEELDGLMSAIHKGFHLGEGLEISLEANPDTVDLERLRTYRNLGVNRLSFGAQSFHPAGLKALGRGHGAEEIITAVDAARRAGFGNVNFDLIFGWQGQTLEDWRNDLHKASALGPEHLSLYSLTVEPGTFFARQVAAGHLRAPADNFAAACLVEAHRYLESRGYGHYEISNYAHPGFASEHNLGYWRYREYLGLGLGAASFLKQGRLPEITGYGLRWKETGDFQGYLNGNVKPEHDPIGRRTAMAEFMMLGLRLGDGVRFADFRREFSTGLNDIYGEVLADLTRDGLLASRSDGITCTPKGFLFHDTVTGRFLTGC